ncbi:hypothetical protein IU449_14380 [Nocardia higoensis]|uniref:Uncharacterized protein n=1 Tax=Nocardia higoensis TaxID=228599 RepID=A0ABS0DB74_9NOCA|nr:hypothetical protein [Nocardia higoensis]
MLDAVERDARSGLEDEDDGDPDYFNAILHLATQMTGYSCGYGIDHPDEEPFEMLQPAGEAAVWERFPFALAEAMVNRGLRGKPSQSEDGYAFTAETDVPGMSVVVRIGMNHGRFGGIEIRGSVSLWSAGVAELLPTLEGTDSAQGNSLRDPGECARSPFHRDGRSAYADTHVMWDSDGIAGGVQWVCDHLDGRIASWLAEHSSLDRLIEAAKSANSDSGWRPSGPSVEMNPTIVLCILNHRYAEAADLMAGALEQSQDRPRAHGRAVSIDNGLAERCPEYAAARSL